MSARRHDRGRNASIFAPKRGGEWYSLRDGEVPFRIAKNSRGGGNIKGVSPLWSLIGKKTRR